jgi:hypothetical protein
MGPRPWKPEQELNGALERGDLAYAKTLAAEVSEDQHGRPLDLQTALRFLPIVAAREPDAFDAWALRWLARWLAETPGLGVDVAANVAVALSDLRTEPQALARVAPYLRP